jgi:glutamate synthase domain-containing protein 2
LKCFVKKKDDKKRKDYIKQFEKKMFMKIVRPCGLDNMTSYVGCKILHKVTLNEEKNKGKNFNLIFLLLM